MARRQFGSDITAERKTEAITIGIGVVKRLGRSVQASRSGRSSRLSQRVSLTNHLARESPEGDVENLLDYRDQESQGGRSLASNLAEDSAHDFPANKIE